MLAAMWLKYHSESITGVWMETDFTNLGCTDFANHLASRILPNTNKKSYSKAIEYK